MTPIFASNRAQVQNWYAYQHPQGRVVIWDGGINRSRVATGFWCPITGNIVDVDDSLPAKMPKVCLFGHLNSDNDRLTVTGFPHVNEIMPIVTDSAVFTPVQYFYDDPQARASFMDEVLYGPDFLKGTPCDTIDVHQLPEDPQLALEELRSLGPDAVARHPWSVWSVKRSCHFVTNAKPVRYDSCRIREIVCSEDLQLVDFVEVWRTVEVLDRVIPMYPGDDSVDTDFWVNKKRITLYTFGDYVVGYE